jgi:hypothetical protein
VILGLPDRATGHARDGLAICVKRGTERFNPGKAGRGTLEKRNWVSKYISRGERPIAKNMVGGTDLRSESNRYAALQQPADNVFAGIAESSCYDIQFLMIFQRVAAR